MLFHPYQTYLCNSPPEIRTHSSYNLHSNVSTQWKRHPCNKNQEDRNFFLNKCSFTIDLPILDFFLKKRKNIPSSNLPLTISVSSPRHRRRLPPPPLPPHPLLSLCHRWQWRLTQPSLTTTSAMAATEFFPQQPLSDRSFPSPSLTQPPLIVMPPHTSHQQQLPSS